MGSINSRPKAPPVQTYNPVVYQASEPSNTKPEKSEEEIVGEARTESLLRRSRGRFGTILTSFKGFLSESDSRDSSPRKTLLGE
jgi:hypothetical protein